MARVIHVFKQPDRFIAGTIGVPGERTFYLQATQAARTISVLIEKQQVAVLADRLGALIDEVGRQFELSISESVTEDLDPLEVPLDEEFRVGTMGLGWDPDARAVVVEVLAVSEESADETAVLDDGDTGPDALRVFLSPDSAKAFAQRAQRVIGAGRAPCPLCGGPLDPTGHVCPRLNGYHRAEAEGMASGGLSEDSDE
jgi:uncharacterized repeat protein (TIGR03847 family)